MGFAWQPLEEGERTLTENQLSVSIVTRYDHCQTPFGRNLGFFGRKLFLCMVVCMPFLYDSFLGVCVGLAGSGDVFKDSIF